MTSSAPSRRRLEFAAADLDLDRFARPVLAVAVVASGLLIYHLTRGSSFSADDWTWIDTRRGNSTNTFLAPYNGHLSLVPIAIYRLMFAVFGIGSFVPYRLLLLVVASVTGLTMFEYTRHRIGEFGAVLAASLLLFLGSGWNDIMQPFQIAWLLAVTGGVLALSLLDHRRTRTDVAACVLIFLSISSTSVGVAFAVGMAVDIALVRRRWRDLWIAALPLALYAVWALHYHPTQLQISAIWSAPANLAQIAGSGVAGVVGLSGVTATNVAGMALTFGISLLVLATGVVVLRTRTDWDHTRFFSLAAALVTFSVLTTLARSFQSPFESRYMYVTCVLVTLMGVELARGIRVPVRTQLVIAALILVAVVSNTTVLRSGGAYLRGLGALTDATLGAVELDRATVAPQTPLTQLPLYPIVIVTADQYFAAAHALGTPAYTLAQLQRASPAAQQAADGQMLADRDLTFAGVSAPSSPTGIAARLERAVGGAARSSGACVEFVPASALTPGGISSLALQLTPVHVSVSAGETPVRVSVRRFAPAFAALGTVQPRGSAVLSISPDRAPQPWHLRVQSSAPVRVCTVSGT
jgi:hypothetical protein